MNTLSEMKPVHWTPMHTLYQEIKKLDYHGAALEAAREVHNQIERLEQSLQELDTMTAPVLKLPLKLVESPTHGGSPMIQDANGKSPTGDAAGREIVRRVNCHDELVAAMSDAVERLEASQPPPDGATALVVANCRTALEHVEKGQP